MISGNKGKEINFFDEEYTTKRDKKTAKNQDGEGLNDPCRFITSIIINVPQKWGTSDIDNPVEEAGGGSGATKKNLQKRSFYRTIVVE